MKNTFKFFLKKIIPIISLLFVFLFPATSMAKTVVLQHMHVQSVTHETRVTLYLSASTHYRAFMLHHPNRFVVDLKNVRTAKPLHFKNFKYATHRDGVFRMVFILSNSTLPKIHVLQPDRYHQARLAIVFQHFKTTLAPPMRTRSIKPSEKTVLSDTSFDDRQKNYRDIIVVIDPGHGGKDPGATGPGGTHEKTIVLSISKKLQRWINQQRGFHAVLTRTGDYYLTLRQRLRIARKDKADMFIAIHADTWRNTRAAGVSVFALSQRGATSEAARWLAARENASELMGGVDLQDKSHLLKSVLINLSQAATIRSSLQIGNDLLSTIKPIARLHHDRVEQAAFVVLKSPDIPSLLVETGFLSNPHEEQRLRSQAYQNKLAKAIMQGICEYFTHYPPRGTWLSYWRNHPHYMRIKSRTIRCE